jgi:hypothetical protein
MICILVLKSINYRAREMKRTWETPELKELTWDKTMSGYYKEAGETTNYVCEAGQEDGIGPKDVSDGNFATDGIGEYPCLDS